MLLFPGCKDNPDVGYLDGTVLLDGNPLPTGQIIFESTGSRPVTGKIDDGKVVLVDGESLAVGMHQLAVSAWDSPPQETTKAAHPGEAAKEFRGYIFGKSLIPIKYNHPVKSGLTANVSPGMNQITVRLISELPKAE